MQPSVPSASVVQATFAATLFDEWIRRGLTDVVICPGSRSTPLVLACAARAELALHVRIDERSAGFFAIGRALATRRPVAVVVTSGTAAAELHACVAEADQGFVPLLVLTADRPPNLHGVGAPQTMNQRELYGAKVRRFEEPGVATAAAASTWRSLARRLWHGAVSAPGHAGPVHLNVAFAEPLVAQPGNLPGLEGVRDEGWVTPVADFNAQGRRVLCVVGRGVTPDAIATCVAANWVVLGDATAQGSLPYFDSLLRSSTFAQRATPDVVVRLGGIPASKVLQERLRQWNVHTVGFDGAGFIADPDHLVDEMLPGLPCVAPAGGGDAAYVALWRSASARVGDWLATVDTEDAPLNEPLVARAVVDASARSGVALVVGSSMPVRDVEWWAPARTSPTYSNRGVNGIDGVVSTALGVAAGAVAVGLVGDVTMLHDVSALVDGLGSAQGTCVLVVVDNGGGGIFSFLPQASVLVDEEFERLFATPRTHDLVGIAHSFGHDGEKVKTRGELDLAIERALSAPGLHVVVADVPRRDENVALHEAWNDQVHALADAL